VGGRQGGRTTSQGNYHLAHPEAKGIDPIRLPNYVRLIMTSNEDWVVPAGMNERRFCVLDVDPRCEQNYEYFREIDEVLPHGGLEYLLADLLAFDLDTVNLRPILRTQAHFADFRLVGAHPAPQNGCNPEPLSRSLHDVSEKTENC
jgi:hypothetical protein